ncbi:hypothetical protein TNCT_331611 [Trichonephila clavata]|uniref:Uncharacterized protein n=1 Tax=Trichonephila clavata TaxID=2740835 RepID=A0A8X6GTG5_TRICU|nr:hypothetical protein TNCT_331611 [Trichonephila clavata]
MSAVSAVDVMSAVSASDRVSLDSIDVLPRDLDNGGKEAVADAVWGHPEEAIVDDVNDRVPIVKLLCSRKFCSSSVFCSIFYSRTNHGSLILQPLCSFLFLLFQPQHKRIEVPQKSVAIQFCEFYYLRTLSMLFSKS